MAVFILYSFLYFPNCQIECNFITFSPSSLVNQQWTSLGQQYAQLKSYIHSIDSDGGKKQEGEARISEGHRYPVPQPWTPNMHSEISLLLFFSLSLNIFKLWNCNYHTSLGIEYYQLPRSPHILSLNHDWLFCLQMK